MSPAFGPDEWPADAGLPSLPPAALNWSNSGVSPDGPDRAEPTAMKAPTWSGTPIVTLTMNPALDITTNTERVIPTSKIRCGLSRYDPGGGGINVARIAHVLGASASALFPAGGHTGDKVTDLVADSGVPVQRINIARCTRE
ncbi:MAG: 6-phosphofructokinase 2, partial [Mycobacterium sp.]|nr:6-phosphofructokinase 2 [Mycobacterium sp.]